MKQLFENIKDESQFVLTDFNCAYSQDLLKDRSLYKIIWSKDFPTMITVDGYSVHLKKDQLLFCTPVDVVLVKMNTIGLISFVFNSEFYCIKDNDKEVSCNGFLFFGSSQPLIVDITQKERESFMAMLLLFNEEFGFRDNIQGEMLRALLKRLLIKSRRLARAGLRQPELPNAQLEVIRKYNILVEQFFREKHQVKEYAELLHKSPKTLSNMFLKYSGDTPLQVINKRILLEAKRLLLFSDKTSEQITYEIGFKNPGHFSVFFKKHEGISPRVFKIKRLQVT